MSGKFQTFIKTPKGKLTVALSVLGVTWTVLLLHFAGGLKDVAPTAEKIRNANRDLKRTASGYGYRIDPIYNVRKFHQGMDFSCDVGTPVYATADGVITLAKWKQGYGWTVEIDHGFNYLTRYAHLKEFKVKRGQRVVRGEQIALSGNTGKSSGPHLHYEVLEKGRPVNPINFYFMDLDAEGYDEMLRMAENHGKIYD